MNNKRQTIWLVSMLSLMVILSAYYLFTEDVTPAQNASGTKQQTEVQDSAGSANGIQVTEEDPASAGPTDTSAAGSKDESAAGTAGSTDSGQKEAADGAQTEQSADGGSVSPEDEAVLKDYTNLKGNAYFTELQRLRRENFDRENEKLTAIIADTKNHSQEEASSAAEEQARLEETDSRMTSLEEKLLQDYDNAVVTEEDMNFKVVVQATKLEKKEAVKIIDLAAQELKVPPSRLTVQYVK
ncbi:hypothetical protein GE107_11965 [Cohnella sp. CFH 77786]|uniref:SpoIIIAH-like family protein n=1 Tax=Cohnella sp. CFH 77786 TaxID=2662265 RepID=UPI001C60F3E0|nr:SpoIIIAH-like family protein [Cohnella sp. CFH 77786]MBW5446778.1 hypothetical protein [Cohnella sp. CFH 77786]